ncbi:MAG: hypothetical protein GX045_11805 [Clostridiaceae bacterium]|nr:hypothetical protein [Clostridiaceae bacterium]
MNQKTIKSVLESLAVGDAAGMPTEFMTRQQIKERFGSVDRLIPPEQSLTHSNLKFASVTDDTEQNVYLINEYCKKGRIDVKETALCLLRWAKETDAEGIKYIGPSSLKALKSIEEGEDPHKTGINGTTCGGIMRTPAAVICTPGNDMESLVNNVLNCLISTHNTSTALEAAMAYAFALKKAFEGADPDEITAAALTGAKTGMEKAPYRMCAASSADRIKYLQEILPGFKTGDELLDFLYNIYGTGLESEDICPAVFGIFLYAKDDVWLAIRLGASAGGDTDTIAALGAVLCCAFAKRHNIPENVLSAVIRENNLDFEKLSTDISNFWRRHR